MNHTLAILIFCLLAIAPGLNAQAAPAGQGQQQGAAPQKQDPNAFPEDITNIPVMGKETAPDVPSSAASGVPVPLPGDEADPVRSPDDAVPESGNSQESSSTLKELDRMINPPDEDQGKKKKHGELAVPEHVETSAEDIEVGQFELERRNWKAALSRFESALVLAPDEPLVYWGLAESERNLGRFAEARENYQKVFDYDPDSKHGKEAKKLLKLPEIMNAKAAEPQPPPK